MPWPALVVPTPGTVITAAWASAQSVDPLNWLRLMTGGADPPAAAYVVVSNGSTSTSWGKVTTDVIGDGQVTAAKLAFGAANSAVSTPLVIPKANDLGSGGALILQPSGGYRGAVLEAFNNTLRIFELSTATPMLTFNLVNGTLSLPGRLDLPASASNVTGTIFAASAAGTAGYILDCGTSTFRVYNNADASKMLAFNLTNNTLTLGGATVITSGTIGAQSVAFATSAGSAGSATTAGSAGSATNATNVTTSIGGVALESYTAPNASAVGGFPASTTRFPNRVPISDASGTLDAWVTPTAAAPVPSGLIAFIANGSVPSGWAFYPAANGRVIVAAGTASVTNAQAFAVATNYGGDWAHAHTVNIQHAHGFSTTHAHGSTTLGVGGSSAGPTGTGTGGGTGGTFADGSHTHGAGGYDVTGTTDSAAPGSSDNAGSTAQGTSGVVWVPPSHALNAIIKS